MSPSQAGERSNAAHTPGPWKYQEQSDAYTHIVRGPNGQFIASCPQGTDGEDEANARLIAKAPDLLAGHVVLLEALKRYVNWFGAAHDPDCPEDDTCNCAGKPISDAVNAAIKQAERT